MTEHDLLEVARRFEDLLPELAWLSKNPTALHRLSLSPGAGIEELLESILLLCRTLAPILRVETGWTFPPLRMERNWWN